MAGATITPSATRTRDGTKRIGTIFNGALDLTVSNRAANANIHLLMLIMKTIINCKKERTPRDERDKESQNGAKALPESWALGASQAVEQEQARGETDWVSVETK